LSVNPIYKIVSQNSEGEGHRKTGSFGYIIFTVNIVALYPNL